MTWKGLRRTYGYFLTSTLHFLLGANYLLLDSHMGIMKEMHGVQQKSSRSAATHLACRYPDQRVEQVQVPALYFGGRS